MQWGTLSRFDCSVCANSAYPPRLSVNADIPVRRPRAKSGCEQLQQTCHVGKPGYSITSSARASSVAGTWRPSALAVFKLRISSTFVD